MRCTATSKARNRADLPRTDRYRARPSRHPERFGLRYIAWAIPAIGFIGTVRGIGDALSQAHKAVTGDISGVTEGLGVAFNSTLIALLLSILLMFLLQQLQRVQERRVLDTETWLDQKVIRNLQAR